LSGTEILVKVCHGKELQKATEQALPIPGVVILSQIFIKIHVHNRGHILAATQVVMFNGYLGILTSTIKNTHQHIFYKGPVNMKKQFITKEEGQLSIHLPKI
jgi:hypothetical protein